MKKIINKVYEKESEKMDSCGDDDDDDDDDDNDEVIFVERNIQQTP